jgi:hypothetical protein
MRVQTAVEERRRKKNEADIQVRLQTHVFEVVGVALLQSRRHPVECDDCSAGNTIVQFFELRRRCSSAA